MRPTEVNLPNQSTGGSYDLCKGHGPRRHYNVQPVHMSRNQGQSHPKYWLGIPFHPLQK